MLSPIIRVAKINDIPFDVISMGINGGVKTSIQELIHGGRYIDFMGIKEPIYEIEGRVYGDERWGRLNNVFNQEKKITFTLPNTQNPTREVYHSEFQCKGFNKSEVGMYYFTITLSESALATDLNKISNSNKIKSSKLAFLSKTSAFITNVYRTTASTIQKATDTANGLASDLSNIANALPSLVAELQLFTNSLQNFQASIQSFINLPATLDSQISSLVNSFAEIGATLDDQVDAIKNMLNGDLITPFDNTSSFAETNSQATNPIQTIFYCYAINNLILKINDKEYQTKEDVDLDIQYLIQQKDYIQNRLYDRNLRNELFLYINNTLIKLKQIQVQLPPVFKYTFENISDSSVYFMYYGNLDNIDAWRKYNKIPAYGIVNQEVKFF